MRFLIFSSCYKKTFGNYKNSPNFWKSTNFRWTALEVPQVAQVSTKTQKINRKKRIRSSLAIVRHFFLTRHGFVIDVWFNKWGFVQSIFSVMRSPPEFGKGEIFLFSVCEKLGIFEFIPVRPEVFLIRHKALASLFKLAASMGFLQYMSNLILKVEHPTRASIVAINQNYSLLWKINCPLSKKLFSLLASDVTSRGNFFHYHQFISFHKFCWKTFKINNKSKKKIPIFHFIFPFHFPLSFPTLVTSLKSLQICLTRFKTG